MSGSVTPWSLRALGAAALVAGLLLAVGFKLAMVIEPDHDPAKWSLLPSNPGNALVAVGMLSVLSLVALAATLGFSRSVFGGRRFIPLLAVGPTIMLGWDAVLGKPVEWSTAANFIIAFVIAGCVYRFLSLRLQPPALTS